jgi:rsbT co-antagonist protein RsbR
MERENGDLGGAPAQERGGGEPRGERAPAVLREMIAHLRQDRARLCRECARHIAEGRLMTAMTQQQIHDEATAALDGYLAALELATPEAQQAHARDLAARLLSRGAEAQEVIGIALLLRDVLVGSLLASRRADVAHPSRILEAYEPAAARFAGALAIVLLKEREGLVRQQQGAILELLEIAAAHQSGALAVSARGELPSPEGPEPRARAGGCSES